MKMEWSSKVTKLARCTLNERHFNRRQPLPKPADLSKLAAFITHELKTANYAQKNPENFRRIVMLTETRLLMYNKRRSGELEAMTYVVN